jgi:hypothetical protein
MRFINYSGTHRDYMNDMPNGNDEGYGVED